MKCSLKIKLTLLTLMLAVVNTAHGQTTIVLTQIPANTPVQDTIFIAGSFNNWNPADPAYALSKNSAGVLSITLHTQLEYFEYKFTRGGWESVEGGEFGKAIANRSFFNTQAPSLIETRIKSWEDLEAVKIVLNRLPLNTPENSSIYVAGNFNDWLPADPMYKMEKKGDHFQVLIRSELDTLRYKFTRGGWASAEANAQGQPVSDHVIVRSMYVAPVEDAVLSWADLQERPVSMLMIVAAVGGVQCLLVVLMLLARAKTGNAHNGYLFVLLFFVSLLLLSKAVSLYSAALAANRFVALLPQLAYFVCLPVSLLYFYRLTEPTRSVSYADLIFLPIVLAQVLSYTPLLLMNNDVFIRNMVTDRFENLQLVVAGGAFVFNLFYLLRIWKLLNRLSAPHSGSGRAPAGAIAFVRSLSGLFVAVFFLALASFVLLVSSRLLGQGVAGATNTVIAIFWAGIALFPYIVSFFIFKDADIFAGANGQRKAAFEPHHDALAVLKKELMELMCKKRPYLNPELTLADLAAMMGTHPHTLSKVINEKYNQNFFDFVNLYRIEEFKTRIGEAQAKGQTLLSVAFDVGFNSKTTFNRAFKKITGSSPREFFKAVQTS